MSGTVSPSFADAFFNATFYLENNPDVVAAIAAGEFTSALQHFELFGQFENRMPNASFNANQYLINNPDVAAAVGSRSIGSAWEHFTTFGVAENRSDGSFPGTFNETAYLAANPDVAAAVAAGDYINGYEHFLLFGQFENRPGTPTSAPGQTFTLTTNADVIPGLIGSGGSPNTTGNDTIVGIVDGNPALSTLNAADNLQPTGTNETLSLTAQDAATTMPAAILNGISTLSVRNVGGAKFTADASLMPGVTAVNSNLSTNNVAFSNVPSGASVGDIGNGVAANGNVTATYVAAANLATVNISGGTTGGAVNVASLSPTALTGAVVSSAGAANKIGTLTLPNSVTTLTINAATNLTAAGVAAAGLTTITAAGAATSVGLGSLAGDPVTTINASGLTAGGVSVSAVGPALTTFTGGAGNDSVLLASGVIQASPALDGGTGTNVLGIGDTGDLATTPAIFTGINAAKNFQTLELTGNGVTADLSKLNPASSVLPVSPYTTVALNWAGGLADTINNLDSTRSLSIINAANGGVIVNAALGAPALTLSLDGGKTAPAAVGGVGLTINGSTSIGLTSNGTATAPDNFIGNLLTTDFNANVTVGGSQNLGHQRLAVWPRWCRQRQGGAERQCLHWEAGRRC